MASPHEKLAFGCFKRTLYVEKYLAAFTKSVSRKWDGKLAYVDFFSGPGRSLVRDTSEEV